MRNWILVPVLAIALVAAVVIFVNADETRMPNETGLIDFDSVIDAQKPAKLTSCAQGPTNPLSSATYNLEEHDSDWGVYCEGTPTWLKENVTTPSLESKSLRCSITGGGAYSNVHCYRNFASEPMANVFSLGLSFWFSPTTTFNNQGTPSNIQALEFTVSKWYESKRYELALQWQNVGVGAPQWRYWDPNQSDPWVSLGITGSLTGEQWHSITLIGEITNGQIHYSEFALDQQSYSLNTTVSPTAALGESDRLAVAIQLDGNFQESPYDVFLDRVTFERSFITQVYLPIVLK